MLRILRGLGSRSLHCGCFVGVYETYAGATVEVVEERGSRCLERSHEDGRVIAPVARDSGRAAQRREQSTFALQKEHRP